MGNGRKESWLRACYVAPQSVILLIYAFLRSAAANIATQIKNPRGANKNIHDGTEVYLIS
jgi:hypothetical protein